MVKHTVKCLPDYFDAVGRGEKPFEVRRDDRGYQKGDILILQRMVKFASGVYGVDYTYQGSVRHELHREITYILTGGQFGIEPGYVVLGLKDHSVSEASS